MKKSIKIFGLILAAAMCLQSPCAGQSPAAKIDLRVLYVGGSADIQVAGAGTDTTTDEYRQSVRDRMDAFEAFLNDYFTTVEVVHADDYTQAMSDGYDVTVMDGRPKEIAPRFQDRGKGIYLTAGYLTEDFDRPMLTIGELGETLGRRIGIKNDWYCLCLDADAHHWRAEHPIFNGPFDVRMTVVDKPTPEGAYHYPYYYDGPIPDRIPMWRVQTKGYMTDEGFRVGMVARPWGYEDSPDAEYISSGVCAKTLDAVAIGRHGNYFHWGFAASPACMTAEAKPVLANAIVYISKFAGQTPVARKYNDRIATREYIKELKYLLTREYYEERKKSDAEWAEDMLRTKKEAQEKQARGEELNAGETRMLSFTPAPGRTFEEHLGFYGKNFYEMFGTDIPAYAKYFDENFDYFYGGEGSYVLTLDEDVKSLGIPNYDKRLLDVAIRLLETGADAARGRRILARYTLADFPDAVGWRNWYETNKDRLFWTESGGWLWLVDSREPGVNDYRAREERLAIGRLAQGETSDAEPVALTADVVVMQDGARMLNIVAKIHPGYHIYDNVAQSDAFSPTTVEVSLPDGYAGSGGMKRPFGKFYNQSGTTVYEGTVVFSQELSGSGAGEVTCKVSYQCCDARICFPPQTKTLTVKL